MLFSKDEPILIIGAGVSGLVLAQGLKHRGIPFRLFERNASIANKKQGYRFRCEQPGLEALQQTLAPELWDLIETTHAKHTPFVMVRTSKESLLGYLEISYSNSFAGGACTCHR